jgi:hypothetical protein
VLYYTSPINASVINAIDQGLLGSFDSPTSHNRYHGLTWCADNGCFSSNYVGDAGYLEWLFTNRKDATRCIFATAPDVLCDAAATLRNSQLMFARIRNLGFPVALVAQNGLEDMKIPWDEFDVLFLGGDTEWKLGYAAAWLTSEARHHGKHVHMGRVNGLRRLRHAQKIGCDSVDGTHLIYGSNRNLPQLLRWMKDINGPGGVVCVVCEDRFRPVRLDSKTCGDRCRQRLSRATRRQAQMGDPA